MTMIEYHSYFFLYSTYINERNMRFNNKMARAYDKYTAEIRANFERGTAI